MAGPLKRTQSQLAASHPHSNVWVSASAGTGKTHVLTDRILRLMLRGSAPERILALTFTRAAAAEMQNRVIGRLGEWQGLPDAPLTAELAALDVVADADMLRQARCLFAHSLNVPGGLRIHTLHGFAQGLLAAFPLEAGLAPGFTALEERDAGALRRRALLECIAAAQDDGDHQLLDDLAQLSILKGESGLGAVLDVMIGQADALLNFRDARGLEMAVRQWLDVEDGEQPGDMLAAMLADGRFDEAGWRRLADLLPQWGTQTAQKLTDSILGWLGLEPAARVAARADLHAVLFTDKGELRKAFANADKKAPGVAALAEALGAPLQQCADRDSRLHTATLAAQALRAGHRVAARYAALKRAALAVDFDDMIGRTVDLLGPAGISTYIGWKLDSRFDHVLVDEAQDTNSRQWRIIDRLVEDFFTGEQERRRSIFVVGDHKQSIYRFQGTDPQVFEDWRARTAPAAQAAGHPLQEVHLALSFRSGPAVLAVVNAFLAGIGGAAIGMATEPRPHDPNRARAAGEVVLWPAVEPVGGDADSDDSDGENGREAADREMARRLAAQVAQWLRPLDPKRLWLPARGRWARPGDIQILLRKRGWLMAALVRELHERGVRVAGVDRLLLTEPLAVLDLLALVRFAVQPEDDLNLACLLVSPLFGWSHEDLRQLGNGRPGLWAMLGQARDNDAAMAARAWLRQVLNLADRVGPYEFLDSILSGPLDGRRRLVARLGAQANDPIDELLQQALNFEQHNPPALAGFLGWIEAEGSDVKRDADAESDQVRLMTIHGAKGLESPVVVLADAATERRPPAMDHVIVDLPGVGPLPLFHPPKREGQPALIAALRAEDDARAAEEDLRLLYVGLTRAADHLFIGGATPGSRKNGNAAAKPAAEQTDDSKRSWHARLQPVLQALDGVERIDSDLWGGEMLRLRAGDWTAPPADNATIEPQAARHDVHGIVTTLAPPPEYPTRPLTPSAAPEDPPEGPAVAARRAAALRGRWIHRLFERLPVVAPAEREAQGLAWLRAQGAGAQAPDILREVLRVMRDPRHAALFGPDALAEAPVAGLVGRQAIVGIVDRMLVQEDHILLVDFKTGLQVPERAAAAPVSHRRQMAAYVEVLQRAFPGHRVEAALLYTAAPALLRLAPADLAGLLPLE